MTRSDVIVFGGYGTFGKHIVREVAASGLRVTIAGRNRKRAEHAAQTLGEPHRAVVADVSDRAACRESIAGHHVAVNAAGPFAAFQSTLLDTCLDASCHYVDIADDRDYVARVRARTEEFKAAGLTAAYGCSSLPGISGAVATVLSQRLAAATDHARVTLFIGNRNPKGLGAVQSAVSQLGKPIRAPQGVLLGFGGSQRVPLDPPFRGRRALNFDSPDYDLLPELLTVPSVTVKVGFELSSVTAAFCFAAHRCPRLGRWLFPRLVPCSGLAGWFGSSGGQIMVELFDQGQCVGRGVLIANADGQRLAALPAVHVVQQLCEGEVVGAGALTAYEAIGAQNLIDQLVSDGFEFKAEFDVPNG